MANCSVVLSCASCEPVFGVAVRLEPSLAGASFQGALLNGRRTRSHIHVTLRGSKCSRSLAGSCKSRVD